nr:MAG TPA: Protein of unknown function (DUF1489) [Caudoviricetes sp.]
MGYPMGYPFRYPVRFKGILGGSQEWIIRGIRGVFTG